MRSPGGSRRLDGQRRRVVGGVPLAQQLEDLCRRTAHWGQAAHGGSRYACDNRPLWQPLRSGSKARVLAPCPAAVSPVLAGTGVAAYVDHAVWWKAALALVVSLALQVGVNYANDYSDGIRGTDAARVGPLRLVGSGVATPASVKAAAFAAFGVAVVAGLVLAVTTTWWLVLVGALAVVAAWYYTGGSTPYGYLGARRGDGVRVLRAGGGGGHDVRADRVAPAGRVVRRDRGGCAGLRDPGGEQPARHPDRPGRRQADAGRGARRRADARALRAARGRGARRPGRRGAGDDAPGVPGDRVRAARRAGDPDGAHRGRWARPGAGAGPDRGGRAAVGRRGLRRPAARLRCSRSESQSPSSLARDSSKRWATRDARESTRAANRARGPCSR